MNQLVQALVRFRDRLNDAIDEVAEGRFDEAAEALRAGNEDVTDTIAALRGEQA